MIRHVQASDAGERFAAEVERVRATGKPVVIESEGKPVAALVSVSHLRVLLEALERRARFSELAAEAAGAYEGIPPTEDEIVQDARETRQAIFHERYGGV